MNKQMCGKPANGRFAWPGRDQESYCCEGHGARLQSLSRQLCWDVPFYALPLGILTCTCWDDLEVEQTNYWEGFGNRFGNKVSRSDVRI